MPYQVVKQFEDEIAEFAGARFGVAVESCTAAIFLCMVWYGFVPVNIPRRTYVGVLWAIVNSGNCVDHFIDERWHGEYQIENTHIIDSALRLRAGMYKHGEIRCLSFHANKHLPIGRGGMVLTDDEELAKWLKLARFDGREECAMLDQREWTVAGYNMYMTPEQASRGLQLFHLKKDYLQNAPDLDDYETYPDLEMVYRSVLK